MSVPPAYDTSVAEGFLAPGPVASPSPSAAARATDRLTELREPALSTAPPPRAQPSLGAAKAIVVPIATPTPKVRTTGHSLRGNASYYCWAGSSPCTADYPDGSGFDAYAAAGPKLRAALGSGWRGRIVSVDGIAVKLIDWCQCYKGQSNEKLLDLYHDVYVRTGSPVVIRW
ncbi:MAG TPA: hypothetical protein VFP56_00485 [Candidatus Limnocylindrales bacterium]|nr:hypothetical protein [Candidatus Limnocylindrales bacterium]